MRNGYLCVIAGWLTVAGAVLQAQSAATQAFDVVSVKPNRGAPGPRDVIFAPGGRFMAAGVPVAEIVAVAYGDEQPLAGFQVQGLPAWALTERFDVSAVAGSPPMPWTPEHPSAVMLAMLRRLLEDRFKLASRFEAREMPVYALLPNRADGALGRGLRVAGHECAPAGGAAPVDPDRPCGLMMGPGLLHARGVTLEQLGGALSRFVERAVVDRTGSMVRYDLELEFIPDMAAGMARGAVPPGAPPPPTNGLSLFTALREQLGLKLEPGRAPVRMLVIERIARPQPD